jgi:hypothetical protein
VKVPPSMATSPGPAICSTDSTTLKLPFDGSLYDQPVVRDAVCCLHETNTKLTHNNVSNDLTKFLLRIILIFYFLKLEKVINIVSL